MVQEWTKVRGALGGTAGHGREGGGFVQRKMLGTRDAVCTPVSTLPPGPMSIGHRDVILDEAETAED